MYNGCTMGAYIHMQATKPPHAARSCCTVCSLWPVAACRTVHARLCTAWRCPPTHTLTSRVLDLLLVAVLSPYVHGMTTFLSISTSTFLPLSSGMGHVSHHAFLWPSSTAHAGWAALFRAVQASMVLAMSWGVPRRYVQTFSSTEVGTSVMSSDCLQRRAVTGYTPNMVCWQTLSHKHRQTQTSRKLRAYKRYDTLRYDTCTKSPYTMQALGLLQETVRGMYSLCICVLSLVLGGCCHGLGGLCVCVARCAT